MEMVEETMGSNDQLSIIRGRRTKRQRPSSPFSLASSSSVSLGGSISGGDVKDGGSSSSAVDFIKNTEEEEDMANCLILLAQGHNSKEKPTQSQDDGGVSAMEKCSHNNSRRIADQPIITDKDGSYVYQCKTCNRCFSSFQALGGHRASHKKPKSMTEEKKALVVVKQEDHQFTPPNFSKAHVYAGGNTIKSSKVHECSICGSEFSSGQALGGHMRRHRTPTATTTTTMLPHMTSTNIESSSKKSRNLLALDLNLPAPEEERENNNNFSFTSKHPSLIFSASAALVDCHY